MSPIFADTSHYVAMLNQRDELHAKALEFMRAHGGPILTTEQVLTETGNWLADTGDRDAFVVLLETIRADPTTTVVWSEREAFDAGMRLYAARSDKEWSVTDCISFVVMKERELADALTADHHFEQAGFRALLK
ncbi:MAG: type II toxin-antitoxin system VapC family toxin [Phycisphaerae bacterium]